MISCELYISNTYLLNYAHAYLNPITFRFASYILNTDDNIYKLDFSEAAMSIVIGKNYVQTNGVTDFCVLKLKTLYGKDEHTLAESEMLTKYVNVLHNIIQGIYEVTSRHT